jgi:L-aspartate oxidase
MDRISAPLVVVGSGIAGLFAALRLAEQAEVLLVTRRTLEESNSRYAQGGIAGVWADDDSPESHLQDTMVAGAGICDERAVEVLVTEGPDRIREMIALGVQFDAQDGQILLTREGGHRCRRILHAHGDSTGWEMEQTFVRRVRENPRVRFLEGFRAVDLVADEHGVAGIWGFASGDGAPLFLASRRVILATGGLGNIFPETTNPRIANGDGVVMAWRAGARVADLEFIQFHPTVLTLPGVPRFLLTEALRGEGAFLRNQAGDRFMLTAHPAAELAPRDVVTRAELAQMKAEGVDHVLLDARHLGEELVSKRFPTVGATLAREGLSLARDLIPVSPAAHYSIGGIWTDLHARTTIPGLFAVGEVAATGIHGANRLASNSLLECLVFGHRAATAALGDLTVRPGLPEGSVPTHSWAVAPAEVLAGDTVKSLIRDYVGMFRDEEGLASMIDRCLEPVRLARPVATATVTPDDVARRHLMALAGLIALFARRRRESRGTHFRHDFPQPSAAWQFRQILTGFLFESPEP